MLDSDQWSLQLDQLFANHADVLRGRQMSRYMRDQFFFHGLCAADRRSLQRQHVHAVGAPSHVLFTAAALWALDARECQLVGVDIINGAANSIEPSSLAEAVMLLAQRKSWWDTVDLLASTALGAAFKDLPTREHYLPSFRCSSDMWLRRCALIFQLKYRQQTDVKLLFAIVDENLGGDEFFINKAIGWALRQHGKTDRLAVEHYVASRELSPLSKREALRQ